MSETRHSPIPMSMEIASPTVADTYENESSEVVDDNNTSNKGQERSTYLTNLQIRCRIAYCLQIKKTSSSGLTMARTLSMFKDDKDFLTSKSLTTAMGAVFAQLLQLLASENELFKDDYFVSHDWEHNLSVLEAPAKLTKAHRFFSEDSQNLDKVVIDPDKPVTFEVKPVTCCILNILVIDV